MQLRKIDLHIGKCTIRQLRSDLEDPLIRAGADAGMLIRSRPSTLLAALAFAALSLAACASADVAAIDRASDADIRNVNVTEVNVSVQTAKPHSQVQAALKDELEKALAVCATGNIAHRMDVIVTDFEEQNVA